MDQQKPTNANTRIAEAVKETEVKVETPKADAKPQKMLQAVKKMKAAKLMLKVQEYAVNHGVAIEAKVKPELEEELEISLSDVIGDLDEDKACTWVYGLPKEMETKVDALFDDGEVVFHHLKESQVIIPMSKDQAEAIELLKPTFKVDPDDAKYSKILGTVFMQGYDGIQDAIKAVKTFENMFNS